MIFPWRRRRGGRGGAGKNESSQGTTTVNQDLELSTPIHFKCPISLELMKDPVTLSTGITYDRESIEKWIEAGNMTCPVTNQVLGNSDQTPNHSLRKMIQDWCVENKSWGVERIPTPRIPVTPYEVSKICSSMKAASQSGNSTKCLELLGKIKRLVKESERNKHCLVGNGISSALGESFESFARFPVEENVDLLKEVLSELRWVFPLDQECASKLKSTTSLRCMAWFLKSGDNLSSRQNAICVLRYLISGVCGLIMQIEGIEEAVFQILKVPIGPKATKAALVVIHHMMMYDSITTLKFVQMGLVPLLLETIVDGDKCVSEKALGVMDTICSSEEGRESAYENAMTIPLLVKMILRVSEAATEFSVMSLWKLLCLGKSGNGVVEAAQQGAFQKLLVVLQIGSGETIKEKVTELLKLMNMYKDRVDCFDSSMGFRHVQRPSN